MIDSPFALLDACWRFLVCLGDDVERALVATPERAADPIGPRQPSFSCLYDGAAQ
jgi:hypothetical protein